MELLTPLKWTFCVLVLILLTFQLSLCTDKKSEDIGTNLGTCTKEESDSEVEICDIKEENKYKLDSNAEKKDSGSIPLDAFLKAPSPKNSTDSSTSESKDNIDEKQSTQDTWDTLQIPTLDGVKVGHLQVIDVMPGVTRHVKTLSINPPIFEIPNFLDPLECDFIMAMAERKGMGPNLKATHNVGITFEDPENTFNTWDYNGDGFIDAEEIVLLPGKIDLQFHEKDALKMFTDLEMDKDNNGKIDLEEFKNTELIKIKEYFKERLQDNGQRRNATSAQAWLWHDEDELLRYQPDLLDDFHERLEAITKIPKEIIQESEPLQVLKYDKGSYHYCQQDSEPNIASIPCCQYGDTKQCRLCRFISMVYFLNDVEEGGELVFPLANSKFEEDIMNNSGNWTGFFTYAKTTGSRTGFNVQLTFKTDGANKVLHGTGTDEGGQFELTDSLVADNIVRFRKKYSPSDKGEPDFVIKYAGRVKGGATIEGLWWVPGHPRMHGNFFMYYIEFENWVDRQLEKCDSSAFCPRGSLVVKPKRGTAIMWYNHKLTNQYWVGSLDDKGYYGNCDVTKGQKWIATNWINIIGDGNTTMRAWRRGKNWVSVTSRHKNAEMLSKMQRNDTEEDEDLIEEMFLKDMKEKSNFGPTDTKPPERHVLSAVTSLLSTLDSKEIAAVSNKIHEKLHMTCIPLILNHEGRIRVVDGSTE